MKKVLVSGFLLALVFVFSFYLYWNAFGQVVSPKFQRGSIRIEYGMTLNAIAKKLEAMGYVTNARKFSIYVRIMGWQSKGLQAGFYRFIRPHSHKNIMQRLMFGREKVVQVTIFEGENRLGIQRMLVGAGLLSDQEFEKAYFDEGLLARFAVPKLSKSGADIWTLGGVEGYLFPDTYHFDRRSTPKAMLVTMNERLKKAISGEMYARLAYLKMSVHEMLTLASIIEKETGQEFERPIIASVFLNRLKKGMRLQTDPTVIFGVKKFDGNLKRKHLRKDHPYNTYTRKGLPPGPIAAPGKESMRAVLWPAETKYLYFVSKNDGTHIFCENLRCHQNAVNKWQKAYFRKKRNSKKK